MELIGEEPVFSENFVSELEDQIKFFHDYSSWVSLQKPSVMVSKDFNYKIGANMAVLGHSFMKLCGEGKIPPYDGLKEFKEWYNTNNSFFYSHELKRMREYQTTLIDKTIKFFTNTFGLQAIRC